MNDIADVEGPAISSDVVFAQIRLAAQDQFKIYTGDESCSIADLSSKDLPFTQHLVHILVSGEEAEFHFKVHFMMDTVEAYTKQKLGLSEVAEQQCIDYVKEFANVVAGKIKGMLETLEFAVGQSLPVAMLGYNELFYDRYKDHHMDCWQLGGPLGPISCSLSYKAFAADTTKRLEKISYSRDDDGAGEIELF